MVTKTDTTSKTEREAKFERAIQAFKAEVQEYDPSILSFLVCRAGPDLDQLECIIFNRNERLDARTREASEGGAA